jgi:opacity protein-like surface antigen
MRKIALLAAALTISAGALTAATPADAAGCYRVGTTGYHWYKFCAGPSFLYPHRRVCHNGRCWYR